MLGIIRNFSAWITVPVLRQICSATAGKTGDFQPTNGIILKRKILAGGAIELNMPQNFTTHTA